MISMNCAIEIILLISISYIYSRDMQQDPCKGNRHQVDNMGF